MSSPPVAWDPVTPPGQLPRALGPPEPAVGEATASVVFAREQLSWVTCPGLDGPFSHLLPASQQERTARPVGHGTRLVGCLCLSLREGPNWSCTSFWGFYFLKKDSQRHGEVLIQTRLRRCCERRWGLLWLGCRRSLCVEDCGTRLLRLPLSYSCYSRVQPEEFGRAQVSDSR